MSDAVSTVSSVLGSPSVRHEMVCRPLWVVSKCRLGPRGYRTRGKEGELMSWVNSLWEIGWTTNSKHEKLEVLRKQVKELTDHASAMGDAKFRRIEIDSALESLRRLYRHLGLEVCQGGEIKKIKRDKS